MGAHLIDGEFQSDKYPTTPRGKVPLSVKDPTAQDLLWEYAQRRRAVDAEFADDLEAALRTASYSPTPGTASSHPNHLGDGSDPRLIAAATAWHRICEHVLGDGCDLNFAEFVEISSSLGLLVREPYDPNRHGPILDTAVGEEIDALTPLAQQLVAAAGGVLVPIESSR